MYGQSCAKRKYAPGFNLSRCTIRHAPSVLVALAAVTGLARLMSQETTESLAAHDDVTTSSPVNCSRVEARLQE
jgi:hypothetical protein